MCSEVLVKVMFRHELFVVGVRVRVWVRLYTMQCPKKDSWQMCMFFHCFFMSFVCCIETKNNTTPEPGKHSFCTFPGVTEKLFYPTRKDA